MDFKFKNNRKFLFKPGTKDVLSNDNLTKARALRFLSSNTEFRKTLFEKLPEDIDEQLKKRNEKPTNRSK